MTNVSVTFKQLTRAMTSASGSDDIATVQRKGVCEEAATDGEQQANVCADREAVRFWQAL